jgi:hypothetical protein
MSDLLETVAVTHGGLHGWKQLDAGSVHSNYTQAVGIMVPTKHRIWPRAADGQALSGLLLVSIDVNDVAFT